MECLSCQKGLELAAMCQVPRRSWVVGRFQLGSGWGVAVLLVVVVIPRAGRRVLNAGAMDLVGWDGWKC
jgi:hypothetical protein